MVWYQFFIRGENYRLNFDEEPKVVGFYTTRNFKADTLEQATAMAYRSIRQDKTLNANIYEGIEPMPTIFVEEIYELEGKPKKIGRWPFRTRNGKGFSFFSDPEYKNESIE